MSQNFRLDKAGYINRNKKISFKFNGKKYFGYEGDTLASALLANGIHLVGRSFKCLTYLRDNLHFHLGPREWRGLALFYEHAAALGITPPGRDLSFAASRIQV